MLKPDPLWIASAMAGFTVGIGAEFAGVGWMVNPAARGVLTIASLGLATGTGAMEISRRAMGIEIEGKYKRAAGYAMRSVSGLSTGFAVASLTTGAFELGRHLLETDWIKEMAKKTTDFLQNPFGRVATRATEAATNSTPTYNAQNFNIGTVEVPKGSNVWTEVVKKLHGSNLVPHWNYEDGITNSDSIMDVIKDLNKDNLNHEIKGMIDFAHVQPGTVDIGNGLTPDQLDKLAELMKSKNSIEFSSMLAKFGWTNIVRAR